MIDWLKICTSPGYDKRWYQSLAPNVKLYFKTDSNLQYFNFFVYAIPSDWYKGATLRPFY